MSIAINQGASKCSNWSYDTIMNCKAFWAHFSLEKVFTKQLALSICKQKIKQVLSNLYRVSYLKQVSNNMPQMTSKLVFFIKFSFHSFYTSKIQSMWLREFASTILPNFSTGWSLCQKTIKSSKRWFRSYITLLKFISSAMRSSLDIVMCDSANPLDLFISFILESNFSPNSSEYIKWKWKTPRLRHSNLA